MRIKSAQAIGGIYNPKTGIAGIRRQPVLRPGLYLSGEYLRER